MKTIIRPTKEHNEALAKLRKALYTIQTTCDLKTIDRCNKEIDEAFNTLKDLFNENKLTEVVKIDE